MSRLQPVNLWLQFFLLAVFVVPSLVPTGFMLAVDPETDLVEITICSGVNHRQVWLDVDTGEYTETADLASQSDLVEITETDICPFAVASLLLLPDVTLLDYHVEPAIVSGEIDYVHLSVPENLSPPSRGPPLLS